ncbi:acyl-CoA dehydrogenase, N-terminal domain protein [Mycolicibacterium hassiacum DSM 44199]|uniref:Acyl-CoA dehydrogenase, N-terminal domain protein n=1 Tax=Mycolicibacterium hassiacum (strain DSM 44199 / CIP 105218 / JCM 12690 / 3849) TaxID=1122247 RepID=K5BHU6_MYCHD|nr:acyl-CoA dehydrogenase family protein [Mycolicibacterium hassiacum]EKF25186.1 acyl-CoA dehydrogenase, N-terminal domain protein [Mycolicibacterium hassiacum DSM 44199]MBX5489382.1 acyl-CoA/acyl-ACP dehydrogenase [Mycolicibacterium hassiacum]MDA4087933.1 acyl-CoA dehydrogenase [Mycolicibacterium hassiacum DSM 44199]VCT93222.1 Acyl-CoA dehydrogenase [Mycolicibacterium hassiacum DSM 44199]
MDFELTDEQRGLVDATRSLLDSRSSVQRARALIDAPDGFDAELWRLGCELGWPALAIPEDEGGLGQHAIDLALVAIELGRGLAATPFIPAVVVADALTGSGHEAKSKILQSISEGSLVATWAFAEVGRPWTPAGVRTRAERRGDGYRLSGAKASVQDADGAQLLLVDALLDDRPARFLVPTDAEGLRIDRARTLDVTRSYCDVTFDGVVVPADALVAAGQDADRSLARTLRLHTVLLCAEMVGIGERLLAMTVDYVKNRVQFGRPVGSFQAVKHKCADMRIWVQACTAATYYAAMTLDGRGDLLDAEHAVSVAKAYTSDAIGRIAGEALQLHGGIGFTWEHDLHLYLRRGRVNALLAGDATEHRERLCRMVQDTAER